LFNPFRLPDKSPPLKGGVPPASGRGAGGFRGGFSAYSLFSIGNVFTPVLLFSFSLCDPFRLLATARSHLPLRGEGFMRFLKGGVVD